MPKTLEKHGLKITQPRHTILNVIREYSDKQFSAYDIIDTLHKKNQKLSNSTVYRVLHDFEKSKIISKCKINLSNNLYEMNTNQPHTHISCIKCHKVTLAHEDAFEQLKSELLSRLGFSAHNSESCLYSICNECASNKCNLSAAESLT